MTVWTSDDVFTSNVTIPDGHVADNAVCMMKAVHEASMTKTGPTMLSDTMRDNNSYENDESRLTSTNAEGFEVKSTIVFSRV